MERGTEILGIREFEMKVRFQTATSMIPPEVLLQSFYMNPETDKFPGLFKIELVF